MNVLISNPGIRPTSKVLLKGWTVHPKLTLHYVTIHACMHVCEHVSHPKVQANRAEQHLELQLR